MHKKIQKQLGFHFVCGQTVVFKQCRSVQQILGCFFPGFCILLHLLLLHSTASGACKKSSMTMCEKTTAGVQRDMQRHRCFSYSSLQASVSVQTLLQICCKLKWKNDPDVKSNKPDLWRYSQAWILNSNCHKPAISFILPVHIKA